MISTDISPAGGGHSGAHGDAPVDHAQAVVPLGDGGRGTGHSQPAAAAPVESANAGAHYAERQAVAGEVGDALADGILAMQADFPDETRALRAEWRGADMVENIGYARSYYESVATPELTALLETVDATGRQLGNSPALLKLAAKLGRQMKHGGIGEPRMTAPNPAPSRDLDFTIDSLTRRMHDAQDANDTDLVNRLARERSALSARAVGAGR